MYPILLASSFIQIIGTINDADRYTTTPVEDMVDEMIAVLLRGIERRSENRS